MAKRPDGGCTVAAHDLSVALDSKPEAMRIGTREAMLEQA